LRARRRCGTATTGRDRGPSFLFLGFFLSSDGIPGSPAAAPIAWSLPRSFARFGSKGVRVFAECAGPVASRSKKPEGRDCSPACSPGTASRRGTGHPAATVSCSRPWIHGPTGGRGGTHRRALLSGHRPPRRPGVGRRGGGRVEERPGHPVDGHDDAPPPALGHWATSPVKGAFTHMSTYMAASITNPRARAIAREYHAGAPSHLHRPEIGRDGELHREGRPGAGLDRNAHERDPGAAVQARG